MNLGIILKLSAVIITVLIGIISLVQLKTLMRFTAFEAFNPGAITEIRTVMGGTYIGMGIAAMVFPIPEVYKTLAIVYIVAAVVRGIFMVVDNSVDNINLILLLTEVVLAAAFYL